MDVIKALAFIYMVLSAADAFVTVMLIKYVNAHPFQNDVESNPFALMVVESFGIAGLLVFKAVLCTIVITLVLLLSKVNHKRHSLFQRFCKPHHVMWFANIATLIAVLCGVLYGILYIWPIY